jgi:hypothetical protein
MLAPIVLFVYNRPYHTQKVIEALKNNPEAKESELFVYCDGAKENASEIEKKQIEETRKIIRGINGFKSVTMIESKENKGLAFSIIEGVTEIVNKYGRIIVLEDDIVTSSGFLKYMNDALEVYSNVKKVMHISGYMFPFQNTSKKYVFFSNPTTCWGWATWKESWSYFEKNVDSQIEQIDNRNLWKKFTLNNTFPSFQTQLFQNKNGLINTWAIFWYASVFLNKGISLHPSISLTNNIGLDGSGENCGGFEDKENPYYNRQLADTIFVKKQYFLSSTRENKMLEKFYTEKIFHSTYFSFRDKLYLFRKKYFF